MQDSIFTKIIKGEIPCHKIYEDEHTFAFLDIYPKHEGHVLVMPKKQVEFVWNLDDETYTHLMQIAKKIALRLLERLPYKYVHEAIVGVDVPHAHIHLIPFDVSSELRHTPPTDQEPDHEALAKIAEKLRIS